MAEITIKGYYGDYSGNGLNALATDLSKLWGFTKIEGGTNAKRLWINEHSYINISRNEHYPPTISLHHKGMQVGGYFGGASYSNHYTGMLAIRTNSAIILSFQTNTSDLRAFPQECIILSDAEHHKQGIVKPVASMFRKDSTSGGYQHYICAEDSSNAEIAFSPSSYYSRSVTYNADITVLEPFVDTRTTTSLRGVYTLATSQMPNDFIGECTLNGRSYYSYNRILIEDN